METQGVVTVTAKAALFKINDDRVWIPLSALASDDAEEVYPGEGPRVIRVHDWFAKKENLA